MWRHHCVGKGNQLFWHGSFIIINGMVDGHQLVQSTWRMSHVFNAAHPSPSRRSLPSSASSVPTVCGWSVCLRTQADTGIQSDRHQDKRTCWSHDVLQLEMTTPLAGPGRGFSGLACGFVYRCQSGGWLSPADVASLIISCYQWRVNEQCLLSSQALTARCG